MDELKIVGWTNFDSEYPTPKVGADGLRLMVGLIKLEIARNGYVFGGEDHQNLPTGVPVFSNGTCFRASMRCWGSIMAEVYTRGDGTPCTYMDFYMSFGSQRMMPEDNDIDVAPARNCLLSPGCTLAQDREIIQQSIDYNMPFITTDKVLREKYKIMCEEQGK